VPLSEPRFLEAKLMTRRLTALIEREGDGYVALCPELDIASQGDSIEQARENLREALELFFEVASAEEVDRRFSEDIFITQVEVAIG
jgi:predicted RNase H-like HicB family nuclease